MTSLPQSQTPTFSQALATALRRHSDQAFGLMGNGNAHLIDGFRQAGIHYSALRHEAGTVAAADAYTRVSGRLAIATATYGAGFSNTLTALAEAAMARTPMLVVVGDAPTLGPRPWDVDQPMLAAAVGVSTVVLSLNNFDAEIDAAVEQSLRERKPVVLAIPYDLASTPVADTTQSDQTADGATTPGAAGTPRPLARQSAAPEASSDALHAIAAALRQAQRPAILAGHGAWLAGVGAELSEIADLVGAVTASTALARGVFGDQSFDLGLTGGFGQEAAMAVLGNADLVLVVGASLNQFTMRFGELFGENTSVIRVDIDPVSAPRTVHEIHYQGVQADAATLIPQLLKVLAAAPAQSSSWRDELSGFEAGGSLRKLNDGLDEHPDGICADGLLDPRSVAARIARSLPEDLHIASDGGHFIGWANMFWPVASPERLVMVGTAYQTIGLGLPSVAGVAAAAPESTVLLSTGDGGALMGLADLETAIRSAASSIIVVWNDAAYGAEVHLYGVMGLDQSAMLIPETDFASLARSFGAAGVTVRSLADLDALDTWREAGATGTILLDCRISRSVVAPYQIEVQRANGLDVE